MRLNVRLFVLLPILLCASARGTEERHLEFDKATDFSKFKTFSITGGTIRSNAPELNNALIKQKIADAIRAQLVGARMSETQDRPDLIVTYQLGSATGRGVAEVAGGRGPGRTEPYQYLEGTLVIDLTSGTRLVWRGVYRDADRNPSRVVGRLPNNIKKLFSGFPPKHPERD